MLCKEGRKKNKQGQSRYISLTRRRSNRKANRNERHTLNDTNFLRVDGAKKMVSNGDMFVMAA